MAPETISAVHDVPGIGCASASWNAGYSLFEVLVALLVLGIGLVGVATLQLRALHDSHQALWHSQLIHLVAGLVEAMQANPGGVAAGAYEAAATDARLCDRRPTAMCSGPATSGSSESVGAPCDSRELARFDVWRLRCRGGLGNGRGHAEADGNSLRQSVSIDCHDADPEDRSRCSPGSRLSVVVRSGKADEPMHRVEFNLHP